MAPCKIRASTSQPVEWLPWKPRRGDEESGWSYSKCKRFDITGEIMGQNGRKESNSNPENVVTAH